MSNHLIAIFGGAVSGAEAAAQLAEKGIASVVFDQNVLPYGKIEDGLPKWHAKLRDKEEAAINEKLSHPLVEFVPKVKLGEDLDFEDVARNWGFSAVLLATGAWRDRELPVAGADAFLGKGLYYQNPFMFWFNHYHEDGYAGPDIQIEDGALVIGGGLASIDVCKALMILNVQKALASRGVEVDMFKLERSIAKVLEDEGLSLEELGVKGCTLVYRRRIQDMPLYPGPTDTPELLEKAERVREKILSNAQGKYLFQVLPNHVPVDKIVKNDRLSGLILRETTAVGGKLIEVGGSDKAWEAPLVISSIGSVPEQIPGIPWSGSVFKVHEQDCCRIDGYSNVFALGNAVTGRGNIKESMQHGKEVTSTLVENYIFDPEKNLQDQLREKESGIRSNVNNLVQNMEKIGPPSPECRAEIIRKVKTLQSKAGYPGNFHQWVQRHLPTRLEDQLGLNH